MMCWRLDDGAQTLVLATEGDALPSVVYWGASLAVGENFETLARNAQRDFTGGTLDALPALTICPVEGRGFPGQPAIALHGQDGMAITPDFRFVSADVTENALVAYYADAAQGLSYTATFKADTQTHIIAAFAALASDNGVFVDWLAAPVVPAPDYAEEMLDFGGRWCGEMQLQHTPWRAGIRMRESRLGRSDHAHFPAVILPERGASEDQGTVYALHYGWSGGHRMFAEELPDGRRQIQFGNAAGGELKPVTKYETAPLYLTCSHAGMNGCAVAFQRHVRDRIVEWPRAAIARPVHYNCWEAVYFDHDLPTLKDIASRAAKLGAERFVLDDGWFKGRDDDTSSLGDWQVDKRNYPDGLAPLIAHINALGMGFGLWFEPEMVNPNSDLYRAHPDWALGPSDQITGRNQLALDLANSAVQDYLFDRISKLLGEYNIEYIKWDHNRVLPASDAAQTRALYALLARLRKAHPKVEIESCASGGGRLDYGMLAHCQRVWLSDSNDALERFRIQHNAALYLPAAVTGSHVGPRKCHTSGRMLDMSLRAWVAASRHMGFEMDPRELTDTEAATLTKVTNWWKANRDWLMMADILRLQSGDPAVLGELHVAADRSRFVAFIVQMETSTQSSPRPIRLTGLQPDVEYTVSLENAADIPNLSRGGPVLKNGPVTLSSQVLMQQGLTLPSAMPQSIYALSGGLV